MKTGSWQWGAFAIAIVVSLAWISGCSKASEPIAAPPADNEVSVSIPPEAPIPEPPVPVVPRPETDPVDPSPPTPIDRLRLGAEAWNPWRTEAPEPLPELRDLALQGLSLGALNLSNMTLVGCNFDGAVLSGADFRGAKLKDCRFGGARLDGAHFGGAHAEGVGFEGADLSQSNFGFATMAAVDLSNATVHQLVGWEDIGSVSGLNVYRIVKAPAAFKAWSLAQGAVKRAPHASGAVD